MQLVQETTEARAPAWPQILILEDEPSVAHGLALVLSDEGYTVDLASSGRSALDNFNQKKFDLLIADLRLPDIDGMEVIKQVRKRRPDTGVIVITGYSTVPSAVQAMKLGASDYLSKPFTQDEIVSAVKVALDASKATPLPGQAAAAFKPAPAAEPLPHELQRVTELMAQIRQVFPGRQDDLIAMLQWVQSRLGFIPEAAMQEIARFTRTPAAAVYGVVTFYEQFRRQPVGRHIIKVCRGTACHVKGSAKIVNEIESRFRVSPGQTSADRMFTLETVACFGSCAIAPVVVVDEKVKGRMNPARAAKTMEDICRCGRTEPVAEQA